MISLDFTDEATINTVLTGDRTKMNKESISNAKSYDIREKDLVDEQDLENDMPYF